MIIDMHNHTSLCQHAEGTMEAYVQHAIKTGTDVFAFTDHAPMTFDPEYRMSFEQMHAYHEEFTRLNTLYHDQIELLFGYEVDYLNGHMDPRVLDAEVDFLIGSVHFIDGWGFDNPEFIGRYEHEDIDLIWERYFELIEAMAKSRLFDVVGHLDLIKVFKFLPKRPVEKIAEKALKAIKAADMVLEINVAGYRKPIGEAYPSPGLLKLAFELGIPITFGSDAHTPEQIGLFRNEAYALARSVGYRYCALYRKRKREMVNF